MLLERPASPFYDEKIGGTPEVAELGFVNSRSDLQSWTFHVHLAPGTTPVALPLSHGHVQRLS